MHIEQAIDCVRKLKKRCDTLKSAIDAMEKESPRISFCLSVWGVGDIRIDSSRDEGRSMLMAELAKATSEIEKLQPVIDMANAALKGVMSDGER